MKLSVLQKMMLFILVPTILCVGIISALNYQSSKNAVISQIGEDMDLITKVQTNQLNVAVDQVTSALRNLSNDGDVIDVLHSLSQTSADADMPKKLEHLGEALTSLRTEFSLIQDVGVTDTTGTVLSHSKPDFIGSSVADRSYIKAALNKKTAPETIVSKATGLLSTAFAIPVLQDDQVLGVVYCTMNLQSLAESTSDRIRIGKTGVSFVYDKTGILLMHPNKKFVGDEDGSLDWVKHMLTAPPGRYDYIWEGKKKIGYFQRIPDVDWLVVVGVEEDEILAPVHNILYTSIFVASIGIIFLCIILVLVVRNISVVLKSISLLMGKIAHGELVLEPKEESDLSSQGTRSDEIGAIARATRSMLDGLRRLFAESEQKTAEATKATAEALEATKEAETARRAAESAKREGMLAAAERLSSAVDIISTQSAKLGDQINQSGHGAEQQAARVAETATAMEEMNSTVLEVARNAGAAADLSASARHKAEDGAQIVQKAVNGIRSVQQKSLALKDDMGALMQQAELSAKFLLS